MIGTIGPNVTLEAGCVVEASTLRDTVVGPGAELKGVKLHDSIIGGYSRLSGVEGVLLVTDHSVVDGAG